MGASQPPILLPEPLQVSVRAHCLVVRISNSRQTHKEHLCLAVPPMLSNHLNRLLLFSALPTRGNRLLLSLELPLPSRNNPPPRQAISYTGELTLTSRQADRYLVNRRLSLNSRLPCLVKRINKTCSNLNREVLVGSTARLSLPISLNNIRR